MAVEAPKTASPMYVINSQMILNNIQCSLLLTESNIEAVIRIHCISRFTCDRMDDSDFVWGARNKREVRAPHYDPSVSN